MKAAILTFVYSYNPGTTLQAFALQKAVDSLDPSVECFIFRQWNAKRRAPLFFREPSWKTLKGWIYVVNARKSHLRFAEKYNHFTPEKPTYKKTDLCDMQYEFDKIIVGSDQLWNPEFCKERPMRYLLDFVKDDNKKVSYGSSFGVSEIQEDLKQDFVEYLGKFKYLSVREDAGQRIIYSLLGREVPVVLDPTLLLRKEDWELMAKLPQESDYIFLYEVFENPAAVDFAKALSKKTGLKIVHKKVHDYALKNKRRYWFMSPEEWMGYIMKARYVVTTSFHGTAFSINFNKQFFVLPKKQTSSRQDTLLGKLGLKDRKIDSAKAIDDSFINGIKDIDYSIVNPLLEEERLKSLEYLRKIIFN